MNKIYVIFFLFLSFVFLHCTGNKKDPEPRKLENYAVINTSGHPFDSDKILLKYDGADSPVPWNYTLIGYDAIAPNKQQDKQGNYKKILKFFVTNKHSAKIEITNLDTTIEVADKVFLTFKSYEDSGGAYILYICDNNSGTCTKSVIINSSDTNFEISSVKYDYEKEPQTLPDGTQNLFKNRITTIPLEVKDEVINGVTRTTGRSVTEHLITFDPLFYKCLPIPEISCVNGQKTKYAVGVELSNTIKEK